MSSLLADAEASPLFRIEGKPHIYKSAGFWRIAVPRQMGLTAREFWYIYFSSVIVFFQHWSHNGTR